MHMMGGIKSQNTEDVTGVDILARQWPQTHNQGNLICLRERK